MHWQIIIILIKGASNNRFRDEIERTAARRGPNHGIAGNVASALL